MVRKNISELSMMCCMRMPYSRANHSGRVHSEFSCCTEPQTAAR